MASWIDAAIAEYEKVEDIFIEVGFGDDPSAYPPLDTATKKRIQRAVNGCSWRAWKEYWSYCRKLDEENPQETFFQRLLFALHGGIPAKKMALLFDEHAPGEFYSQALEAVLARGDRFAAAFCREMIHRAAPGWPVAMPLDLRRRLDLDIPFTPAFGAAWAAHVSWRLADDGPLSRRLEELLLSSAELFELACSAPGDNESTLRAAVGLVQRNVMDSGVVIPLVIQNLGVVARPLDRRRILETLQTLEVSDEVIRQNYRSFLEALSAGDGGSFYEGLIPVLVDPADDGDDRLIAVVMAATITRTKKARRQLLQVLTDRSAPGSLDISHAVLEILIEADPVGTYEKEIAQLRQRWGLVEEGEAVDQQEFLPWLTPPAVWTPEPLFSEDSISDAELLIEQLAELNTLGWWDKFPSIHGPHLDRALALILRMEQQTPGSAALICAGMPEVIKEAPNPFGSWGRSGQARGEGKATFTATILNRIHDVPVLLSTPRDVSLGISLNDLITALKAYGQGEVIATDLYLAVARLIIWSDKKLGVTEEQLIQLSSLQALFRTDEKPEGLPSLKVGDWIIQVLATKKPPVSRYSSLWHYPGGGAKYLRAGDPRLAANLAVPWNSGVASALVDLLKLNPEDRQVGEQVIGDGFHRGLLHPGAVDLQQLSRNATGQLESIGKLADALGVLAHTEDMLCIVWPILTDIVEYSAGDSRPVPGITKVLDALLSLAPSVFQQQEIPEKAKEIPGVRQIAQREGTSAAVKLAKKIVSLAPYQEVVATFPQFPPSRGLWETTNVGVPVIPEDMEDTWSHYGVNITNVSKTRIINELERVITCGAQNSFNALSRIAKITNEEAFTQVVKEFIDRTGPEKVELAKWMLWAYRVDDSDRTNPVGLVSRTWPIIKILLTWTATTPKLARETGVILDAAIIQAPEVVYAVRAGEADPAMLNFTQWEGLAKKSASVTRKAAHLRTWISQGAE